MPPEGFIAKPSPHAPKDSLDRLENILSAKGITVFARIDHAAGAATVGETLPETEVLIFGNPKMGTPLMQATPTIAIDLPLRVLAWRDDKGSWIAYNDPQWLADRHGNDVAPVLAAMADVLDNLTTAATAPE